MDANVSFLAELRRRNVIRVAIAYAAVSWFVLQVGALVFQALDLPNSLLKGLLALLVIGAIPVLVFSWVYELTPEGLKRERDVAHDQSITHLTGRKLDVLVTGVLVALVALLLVDKFVLSPRLAARTAAQAAAEAPKESAPPVPATPAVSPASIAVLPFLDMSQAKDQEYFSDGISEELLNLLAQIPQLHVAARTSSCSFKGKNAEIPEIARQLLVANVLEGSVRKAGDKIRITAQLVRATDGYHLWSQTYDRKLDDVFKIQDEIAAKVVEELKVTLLGAAPKTRETNPEAFALYLQAKHLGRQFNAEALAKSDELYQRALAIDPRYTNVLNGLAVNAANEALTEVISLPEGASRAREYVRQTLEIDPDFAPSYAMLGAIAVGANNDLAGAAKYFERALALDPGNQQVRETSCILLGRLGRMDEAVAVTKDVLQHDPVNPITLENLGLRQRALGRFDDALASLRAAILLSPNAHGSHAAIADALLLKGDAQAALAELDQEKAESARLQLLPIVYFALGRQADSDAALASLVAKYQDTSQSQIAAIHAFRGEADAAFAWLDKALDGHDIGLFEIGTEPYFAGIRSDPRWLPFLRKIGIAPEQLARIEFKIPPRSG